MWRWTHICYLFPILPSSDFLDHVNVASVHNYIHQSLTSGAVGLEGFQWQVQLRWILVTDKTLLTSKLKHFKHEHTTLVSSSLTILVVLLQNSLTLTIVLLPYLSPSLISVCSSVHVVRFCTFSSTPLSLWGRPKF